MQLCRGVKCNPQGACPEALNMDGWQTILSFWVSAYFQGRGVSFTGGTFFFGTCILSTIWWGESASLFQSKDLKEKTT